MALKKAATTAATDPTTTGTSIEALSEVKAASLALEVTIATAASVATVAESSRDALVEFLVMLLLEFLGLRLLLSTLGLVKTLVILPVSYTHLTLPTKA